VTLAAVSGGWAARFECARRCSAILGTRNLENEILFIPMEEIHKSILKLAESLSVALVDTVTDDKGTRFVLVWRIHRHARSCPSSRRRARQLPPRRSRTLWMNTET
jgi:hypothetical protein